MFIKAPAWAHEEEMRIVMKLEHCRTPFQTPEGRQIYPVEYPLQSKTFPRLKTAPQLKHSGKRICR